MRKLMIILFLFIFLLGACMNTTTNENNSEAIEEGSTIEAGKEAVSIHKETNELEDSETKITEEKIETQYYIDEDANVIPIDESVDENVVLLTIDDAPSDYTLEMAETLKELDASAIFFVNGHFLETTEDEEALRSLHEMGFVIGNHTYTHPLLPDISEEEQREEIVRVSDRVEEIIGERPKFFRAPNGMNTDFSEVVVEEEGMVLMNWTYGYDYFEPYQDVDKLVEAMVTGEGPEADVPYSLLKPGANLLMHDREWTNEALERIVTGLREDGYKIVDPHLIEVIDEDEKK